MRAGWAWLCLTGCSGSGPADSTPPTPPTPSPDCSAYAYRGEVYDCAVVDRCDDSPQNLTPRLACCECDPELCEPALDCPPPGPPPEFPADIGPELVFDAPLLGSVLSTALQFIPAAGGLIVAPTDPAEAVEWSCPRDGNTLRCEAGSFRPSSSSLSLSLLEVRLTDGDGDGRADGGWVRASGSWIQPGTPVNESRSSYEVLETDRVGPTLRVPETALPGDRITVWADELLDGQGSPTLSAGSTSFVVEPVPGIAGLPYGYMSSAVVLPWSTPLTLDGALHDVAGNPSTAVAGQVLDDPGSWADNTGFEQGDVGWAARGSVGFGTATPSRPPVEGTSYSTIYHGGVLVAEVAFPEEASELVFHWGLDGPYAPQSANARLLAVDGQVDEIWAMQAEDLQDCAGNPCMPWTEEVVDVRSWAGRTAFLRFEVVTVGSPLFLPSPQPPGQLVHFTLDAFSLR